MRRREESVEERMNEQRAGIFDQEDSTPGYLGACMEECQPAGASPRSFLKEERMKLGGDKPKNRNTYQDP